MENKTFVMTLGQFLKYENLIGSGGEAKHFLQAFICYVNDEKEMRRGKKLYPGDKVEINGEIYIIQEKYED